MYMYTFDTLSAAISEALRTSAITNKPVYVRRLDSLRPLFSTEVQYVVVPQDDVKLYTPEMHKELAVKITALNHYND